MASQAWHQHVFACVACELAGAASEPGRVGIPRATQLPSILSKYLLLGTIVAQLKVSLSRCFKSVQNVPPLPSARVHFHMPLSIATLEPYT